MPRPTVRAKWTRNPHLACEYIHCVFITDSPVSLRFAAKGNGQCHGIRVERHVVPKHGQVSARRKTGGVLYLVWQNHIKQLGQHVSVGFT
jgi:hypothetical protein